MLFLDVQRPYYDVVNIITAVIPVGGQIPYPNSKDAINVAFTVEEVVAMVWDKNVYLVVGIVECSPYDYC